MTAATFERPIVELRDVFCVHRTPEGDAASLQGATLEVGRGELVGVIGPSGAGKSTLLRTIAGLQRPSAGTVRVLGHDIGRLPARNRGLLRRELIGFLGQRADSVLPADLRVRAAVELPLALRGTGGGERRARAGDLLERVGLADRADAYPAELSGGERQRIALCAALAHRPALLLADEPTGELDPASADAIRGVVAELVRSIGVTAIIVSHDAATERFADRCVRIRDGRVVEDRRNGDGAFVLGRGGWLQLPAELLSAAGIGDRVSVRPGADGLVVSAAASHERGADTTETAQTKLPTPSDDSAPVGWTAASVVLRAVTRSRGTGAARLPVLDAVDCELGPGGLIAITGRSGAGKTTLLRLIAGLDAPDSGTVSIDGTELSRCNAEQLAALRRERIGYLPQEPVPIGFLSAQENLALALRIRGIEPDAADDRARAWLARVGLADHARQRVARLSAGEAQRVALARALASARGLLIVDEPTSRLDRAAAAAAAEALAGAAAQDRQTVVCATHDPDVLRHASATIELAG